MATLTLAPQLVTRYTPDCYALFPELAFETQLQFCYLHSTVTARPAYGNRSPDFHTAKWLPRIPNNSAQQVWIYIFTAVAQH